MRKRNLKNLLKIKLKALNIFANNHMKIAMNYTKPTLKKGKKRQLKYILSGDYMALALSNKKCNALRKCWCFKIKTKSLKR